MSEVVKWVVVERNMRGRYVALRGVSYPTQAEAEAHIVATFREPYRKRYHTESRAIKADDDALRMTCQCCGRKILANLGSIALHGYERPDYGYQTASCMGAKKLPFEVDRNILGRLIAALGEMQARMQGVRDQIADEVLPVERHYKVGFGPKAEKKSFKFTRANFASPEASQALRNSGRYESEFDDLLKVELAFHDNRLRGIANDIKMQQERFDSWKQSHEWRDGQWAVLVKEKA